MLRRLFLLFPALLAANPQDDLNDRITQFNTAWVAFLAEYYHCPHEFKSPEECKPALGSLNYKAWNEASKKAARLFGLQEPK